MKCLKGEQLLGLIFRQHEQRLFCTLWLTRESCTTGYQVCLHTCPAKENKRQERRQEKAQKEKDCRRTNAVSGALVKVSKAKKDRPLRSTARMAAIRGTRSVFIGILLTVVIFKMVNATRSSRRTIEHVTHHREAARNLWQQDGLTPPTRHPQRTSQSSFVQVKVQFSIGVERVLLQSKLRLSSCHASARREG